MSWSEFRQSYAESRLFGMLFSCVYTPLMRLPAEFLSEFRNNQSLERASFVRRVMSCDAEYANVIRECFGELIGYVDGCVD